MTWRVWFVQLSGWPVFLAVVAAIALFMVLASVVLTWLGNRSWLQSMLIAALAVLLLSLVLLITLSVLTAWNVRTLGP